MPFNDGSRAKHRRANEHITLIGSLVDTFLKTAPYKVSMRQNPDQRLVYFVSSVSFPPEALSLTVGDAIHNLRSALDHLAYQLVDIGTAGKGPFEDIYFPIAKDAQSYEKRKARKVAGMRKEAIDAIDAIKPYGGANDLLWNLHRLDIADKHRLLIAVGSAFQSVNIGAHMTAMMREGSRGDMPWLKDIPDLDAFFRPADNLFPLKVGDELFIDAPGAKMNPKLNFRFNVSFGEAGGKGEPMVETLKAMSAEVEKTITALERLLV
jgi:hypothetical protein